MILTGQSYHLKDIVKMTQGYFAESPYKTHYKFDNQKWLDFVRKGMISPLVEVGVAEHDGRAVGFSIAYLHEIPWCDGVNASMEFLYVSEEHRGQGYAESLLEYMSAWAKSKGAMEITGGDIGLRPKLTERFLTQQGFTDTGVVLRKVLVDEVE